MSSYSVGRVTVRDSGPALAEAEARIKALEAEAHDLRQQNVCLKAMLFDMEHSDADTDWRNF